MHKLLTSTITTVIAVVALSVALVGTAVAGPTAAKVTTAKVKKIAKKQIAKAAPKLSVKNASTVGGRSVGQLKTVLAGNQNSSVITSIGNVDTVMVSVAYTLAAASTVQLDAVAELDGDGSLDDAAECFVENDGSTVGLLFEVTFDNAGSDNPTVNSVLATLPSVPAGAHLATLACNQVAGTGTVTMDDSAIQVTAVPN